MISSNQDFYAKRRKWLRGGNIFYFLRLISEVCKTLAWEVTGTGWFSFYNNDEPWLTGELDGFFFFWLEPMQR
jgi:hypothetical protein